MASYHWLRIRAAERTWTPTYERLLAELGDDIRVCGAFSGMFGVGSNELMLVVHGEHPPTEALTAAGFEVAHHAELEPTVRPVTFEPRTRAGLYVFRAFDVPLRDVEEIARLSDEAWTTFETGDYAAEAQALFAPVDRSQESGTMLLVTWYDGLDSWQASRGASPEATENFRRRRELTLSQIAYATQLVLP